MVIEDLLGEWHWVLIQKYICHRQSLLRDYSFANVMPMVNEWPKMFLFFFHFFLHKGFWIWFLVKPVENLEGLYFFSNMFQY